MSDYDSYIQSIKGYARISKEREKELSHIINNSKDDKEINKAKAELIESNLLLVVSRALKMKSHNQNDLLMDLISEGNIALTRAADIFNSDRDGAAAFGTLATIFIDNKMCDLLKRDRLIYVPPHNLSLISKIKKLENEYGEGLTEDIIVNKLHIKKSTLKLLQYETNKRTISLEELYKIDGDDSISWEDRIADKLCDDPSRQVNEDSLKIYLEKYIKRLSEREQKIIKMMFDTTPISLREASIVMRISPERVRQIMARSLRKLRTKLMTSWNIKDKPLKFSNLKDNYKMNYIRVRYAEYRKQGLTFEHIKEKENEYGDFRFSDFTSIEPTIISNAMKDKDDRLKRKIRSVISELCVEEPT